MQSLNLAYTEFDTSGFEYLQGRRIEKLDISCTQVTDLMPLTIWKETLTHLTIFNYNVSGISDSHLMEIFYKYLFTEHES